MLSLTINANSRNLVASGNVMVAEARVVAGAPADGSQLARLPASPHCHVEPCGSMIIAPNRPLMFWYSGSDGNRFSEPNSTGVYVTLPPASRSILPAYH